MRYEVIESKVWEHKQTGHRVSIYGASPWNSQKEKEDWCLVVTGYTVRNPFTNEVGIGRQPWATREAAEKWASEHIPSKCLMYD